MVHKWRTGHTYAVGDLVTYHGYYYKVLQAHTSESDWVQQGQCDTFFSSPQDKEHLKNAHDEVTNAPHQAKLSHELIAGAAAWEAARVYQHHQARNGEKPHHRHVKQLFSGAIGVYIDRIVETKGLDALDKKKAKREAQSRVEAQAQSNYS